MLISLVLFSCNNIVNEYYDDGQLFRAYEKNIYGKKNGNFKEYYLNGKLKIQRHYINGKIESSIFIDKNDVKFVYNKIKNDSSFCKVFKDNRLFLSGYLYKGIKIDIWEVFDSKGKLFKKQQYISLCSEQYLNQFWEFNEQNEIVNNKSNFFDIDFEKKKHEIGDSVNVKIKYYPILGKNSKNLIFLSPAIDKDFCNIKNAELDINYPNGRIFDMTFIFETKGVKNLRGYIQESLYNQVKPKNNYAFREVYFDIPIIIE